MKTRHIITYGMPWGDNIQIPAGTPVTPATNLPQGGWWVEKWEGMDLQAESWLNSYGFLLRNDEVTE